MWRDQKTCSVPNCRFISGSIFSAPDQLTLIKWKKALNTKENNLWICSSHFEERYLKPAKLLLRPEAVPSLYLEISKSDNTCQCCLKKNIPLANDKKPNNDFFTITELFQTMFEKLIRLRVSWTL